MTFARLCGILAIAAAWGACCTAVSADVAEPTRVDPAVEARVFRAALDSIAPTVVRIDTIGGVQRPTRELMTPLGPTEAPAFRQADGPTTGVIWTTDGYIVTSSFNFVRDPSIIIVTLADGSQRTAQLVARDRVTRLALVRIDADALSVPTRRPSDELRPAQTVLTAGCGHGTDRPALTSGVISATRRMRGIAIQIDAKTSPANYGGPVFDIDGQLLGICVPLGLGADELAGVEWYGSGIGFAIDADLVAARVERMKAGADLTRGYLGVRVASPPRIVGATDDDERLAGVRVIEAMDPAAAAGLQPDDVIAAIDGQPTPDSLAVDRVLARRVAGDEVSLTIERDGRRLDLTVTLAGEPGTPPGVPTTQPTGEEP